MDSSRSGLSSDAPSTIPALARRPRAVLFDLDGTLYRLRPMQLRMAFELSLLPVRKRSPRRAARVWRRIRTFRKVREDLREQGRPEESLAELQVLETARRLDHAPVAIEHTVDEWMRRRPLRWVANYARHDLVGALARLKRLGLELGIYSDDPVEAKLRALGVDWAFPLQLCSTDPEINALKPHPGGFLRACEAWGLAPAEVLYVGDRADVDVAGARAAGMDCALIGAGRSDPAADVPVFETLTDLARAVRRSA